MKRISFFSLLLLVVTALGTANAQTIGIMTTPPGSFTHSAGSAVAKIMVEKLGLKATVQPGSIGPFGAIDAGLADYALCPASDLSLAVMGVEEYKEQGPKQNLRMVATLMPMWAALHVLKDSDIKAIKDLKGKRVPSGFHATKAIARTIEAHLANAGLTYNDVKQVPTPNASRGAEDFGNGKTDVLYFALGSAAVMEVSTKVGGLRVLPLDDSREALARMQKILPVSYVMEVNPSATTVGLTGPTKLATQDTVIYTHVKSSEEVVYKVVKAIYQSKEDLVASFAGFRSFSVQRMSMPVPKVVFHPGAIRFYKEIGLWPPK
jgi:TRAP transporter TAXI family solute receptor